MQTYSLRMSHDMSALQYSLPAHDHEVRDEGVGEVDCSNRHARERTQIRGVLADTLGKRFERPGG